MKYHGKKRFGIKSIDMLMYYKFIFKNYMLEHVFKRDSSVCNDIM